GYSHICHSYYRTPSLFSFKSFPTRRSSDLCIFRLVYLCCVIYFLVEKKIYIKYDYWKYIWCIYSFNRLGDNYSSYSYCANRIIMILFLWQIPHTFAIAMRRRDEYKAAGIPMLPVVYGMEMTKRQSLIYILLLFPLPFFMGALGTSFLIIATVLNIAWIILAVKGF